MRRYIFAVLIVATVLGTTAQELTIPQAVERARPGPFVRSRISELAVSSFEAAAREADLIVVGRLTVRRRLVHLTRRRCTQIMLSSHGTLSLRKTHAAPRRQGRIQLSSVYGWWNKDCRRRCPESTTRVSKPSQSINPCCLFLTLVKEIGKYQVYDHGAYTFRIGAGKETETTRQERGNYGSSPRRYGCRLRCCGDSSTSSHETG